MREELKEKILDRIPNSLKRDYDVEKYAHEYVYKLEIGKVKIGDNRIIKEGMKEVYKKIGK